MFGRYGIGSSLDLQSFYAAITTTETRFFSNVGRALLKAGAAVAEKEAWERLPGCLP